MKALYLCVLLISAAMLVPETEAGICVKVCGRICKRWSILKICISFKINCHKRCTRSIDKQELVPLAWNFDDYDSNLDGKMTLTEFAAGAKAEKKSAIKVFSFSDANDDGYLSPKEFHDGPFLFDTEEEQN